MNKSPLLNRLSLFGLAGIASNSINILTFWVCISYIQYSPLKSGTIAYFVGMLVGFYMNHQITFKGESKFGRRLVLYFFIQIFIYLVYSTLNVTFIKNSELIATVWHLGLILICAILNFCLTNYLWSRYAKT